MSEEVSNLTITRLKNELKILNDERESFYQVVQHPTEVLKFYFMMRGDNASSYNGGYYIGRIELPADYPKNPGNFFMLTPSGRFSVGTKICLTNSGYHKETWSPIWNLKNMVIAFSSIFLDDGTSGISHIKDTPENRKKMARDSIQYNLTNLNDITKMFTQFVKPDGTFRTYKEIDEYIANIVKEEANKKKAEREAKKARKEEKRAKRAEKKAKKAKKKAISTDAEQAEQSDDSDRSEEENKEEKKEETTSNVAEQVHVQEQMNAKVNAEMNVEVNAEENIEVNAEENIEEKLEDNMKEIIDELNGNTVANEPTETHLADEKAADPVSEKMLEIKDPETANIKVKRKRVIPKNREEWKKIVEAMTIKTHDSFILSMSF